MLKGARRSALKLLREAESTGYMIYFTKQYLASFPSLGSLRPQYRILLTSGRCDGLIFSLFLRFLFYIQ